MELKKQAEQPLFSVIIPAYNAAAYLENGVQSVLRQTCSDWELLLVDDGSADETWPLCQRFAKKDARIRVFHQENGGHTAARNTGLVNSRGAYIVFLDSDDYLDPEVLQQGRETIESCAPDVIVYGIVHHFPQGEKRLENLFSDGRYNPVSEGIFEKLLMDEDGAFAFPKTLNGKIFRRETILPVQLAIPPEVRLGEDGAAFAGAALRAKTICVTSAVCYHLLVRDGSVSRSGDPLSMQRHICLLRHYRQEIVPQNALLAPQFDRFVVAELYTALQVMMRGGCGRAWLRDELQKAMEIGFIREGMQRAQFGKAGRKLQIKRFLICHRMFGTIRLLDRLKEVFGCGKYRM